MRAPGIGVTVLLPRTLIVTSPVPSRRTDMFATSPGLTFPLMVPSLPVAGSSTVNVNVPAVTTGNQKRPCASVTTFSSWMPCGTDSHTWSSPLPLQTTLNSSDLYLTITFAPAGCTPLGSSTTPLICDVDCSWRLTVTVAFGAGTTASTEIGSGLNWPIALTVTPPTQMLLNAKAPVVKSVSTTWK